jgi:hypothetical protein
MNNNIELNFVPYQIALDMKLIGFNEPCFGSINKTSNSAYIPSKGGFFTNSSFKNDYTIPCPMYSQAFRFFREKYELSCIIELTDNSTYYYYDFTISDSKNRDYNDEDCFDSCKRIYDDRRFGKYEEAEIECLKNLISLIKGKTNE